MDLFCRILLLISFLKCTNTEEAAIGNVGKEYSDEKGVNTMEKIRPPIKMPSFNEIIKQEKEREKLQVVGELTEF